MFAFDLAPAHTHTYIGSPSPGGIQAELNQRDADGFICTLNVERGSCKNRVTDRIIAAQLVSDVYSKLP